MGTNSKRSTERRSTAAYDEQVSKWKRERTTTIVLEERADGSWHATQRGVDVHGYGETAAVATAAYCRRVDGRDSNDGRARRERTPGGSEY